MPSFPHVAKCHKRTFWVRFLSRSLLLCNRLSVAKDMLGSRLLGVAIRRCLSSQVLGLVLVTIAHFPQALLCCTAPHQVGLRMEQFSESK
jgi:hypothetical protein